jgi:magnesium transporter
MFMVLKMMSFSDAANTLLIEHVSLILGKNYVISLIEDEGDLFDTVRNRIRAATGRIRLMKADYLAYSLMDAVVDHYFLTVERIGDRIEDIDEQILIEPRPEDIKEIHQLKRDILHLRKAVWPFREEVGAIAKSDSALLHAETKVFWRDLYDHTIQIIDMAETCRDILGGMHDTYLSSISNRMNEVMKMLTIISTIFIPLTFIVGVYGMNFDYMPELKWHFGYGMIWAIMLVISLGLFIYFKRKKWL